MSAAAVLTSADVRTDYVPLVAVPAPEREWMWAAPHLSSIRNG